MFLEGYCHPAVGANGSLVIEAYSGNSYFKDANNWLIKEIKIAM
jgi:hypothetical protein